MIIHASLRRALSRLYRASPEGLAYTAGLAKNAAARLQAAAWVSVQAYFAP